MNDAPLAHNNRLGALAADIRAAHADIQRSAMAMAERAIGAGKMLAEAKAAIPHGGWDAWLRDSVGFSPRTARRYMQIADSGLKTATVAVLGIRGATDAVAAWPLPKPGEAIRFDSTRHWPDELTAFVWPAIYGFCNLVLIDGEFESADGPRSGHGGSMIATRRAFRSDRISYALQRHGFCRDALRVKRFSYRSPGELEDLAAFALGKRENP